MHIALLRAHVPEQQWTREPFNDADIEFGGFGWPWLVDSRRMSLALGAFDEVVRTKPLVGAADAHLTGVDG